MSKRFVKKQTKYGEIIWDNKKNKSMTPLCPNCDVKLEWVEDDSKILCNYYKCPKCNEKYLKDIDPTLKKL